MNTQAAAEHLGVTPATIRQYVHESGLPVLRFPGRKKWLFRKDLIDKWVEEQSTPQVFVEDDNTIPVKLQPNINERFPNIKSVGKGKSLMFLP